MTRLLISPSGTQFESLHGNAKGEVMGSVDSIYCFKPGMGSNLIQTMGNAREGHWHCLEGQPIKYTPMIH